MAHLLFDDRPRTGPAYRAYGESVFDFYNRVDSADWARVRVELEDWYSEYPDDDGDLRKRFRNRREDQHFGAWWELWVYTFYRRLGYEVAAHPTMPNGTKPDFVVTRDGTSTYVECKAIPEKPRSADEARILDCTNEVKNPDFLLELEIDQPGTRTPSCNAIKTQLQQRLGSLKADKAISDREAGKDFPRGFLSRPRQHHVPFPITGMYSGGLPEMPANLLQRIARRCNRSGEPSKFPCR
jgi:hypothetical protein